MKHTAFADLLTRSPFILGEGAVIERLRRHDNVVLDPHLVNAAFIYDRRKCSLLEAIYRQYLAIGCELDVPLLISTPTWRASRGRIAAAGLSETDINGDNVRFFDALRKRYGEYSEKVIICGLMSCHGDAYQPAEALTADDAYAFHAWQAGKLAEAGVDFLLASTLPALSEAIGLARAFAATGQPYIISFVVRPEGTLLDGTSLNDAITAIDEAVFPQPLGYMINCTHASFARSALLHNDNSSHYVRQRMVGLLANTAARSPEDLNESTCLVEEEPESFGKQVAELHHELGLKILGGCCGTDDRHIRSLATHLKSSN